jgi:DNA-binding NarL/FixJ family response regulator
MRSARVVIANRNPLISRILTNLLTTEGNFEVIADCVTISECIRIIRAESPDIAIIETPMSSNMHGQDVLAAIASACFFTRVVFLAGSSQPIDTSVNVAYELPFKGSTLAQCLTQIVTDHRSGNSTSHHKSARQNHPARHDASSLPRANLTEREREIIHEISEGISNKEAARRLNISEGTIKLHLHHIYHKLSIRNRAELVAMVVTRSGPAWLVV